MKKRRDQDKKYIQFYFDGLIRKYFRFIKLRAGSLVRRMNLFSIDRFQRQAFIERMDEKDCAWHIDMSERLFSAIFDII